MYRTEMTIPVKHDSRTFEESRSALFDNLERRCATQQRDSPTSDTRSELSSSTTATGPPTSSLASGGPTQHSSSGGSTARRMMMGGGEEDNSEDMMRLRVDDFFNDNHFDTGVSEWIKESRRKWDTDMKRLRENFFNLESSNDFFGTRGSIGSGGGTDMWPHSLASDLGGMRLSDGGYRSSSQQQHSSSSSSTLTSKTMNSNGGSMRNGIGSGNNNGSTTSSSHTSESSHFSTGPPPPEDSLLFGKRSLFGDLDDPFARFPASTGSSASGLRSMGFNDNGLDKALVGDAPISNAFDVSKNLYELGDDGKLHFKVRFEANDYSPDDIQVTTIGNRLMVKAKTVKQSGNSSSVKEFSRSVDLPDRIDHDNFNCHLTKDGVLEIDAPVKAPDYEAISFSDGELGIKPRILGVNGSTPGQSSSLANSALSAKQLTVLNNAGPTIVSDGYGKKRIHIELQVEQDYLPDDIHVRAEGNRIYIKGRHEEFSGGRSSVKEFSKYYDVPESVDPLSVDALLTNKTLVIEAPLKFS